MSAWKTYHDNTKQKIIFTAKQNFHKNVNKITTVRLSDNFSFQNNGINKRAQRALERSPETEDF